MNAEHAIKKKKKVWPPVIWFRYESHNVIIIDSGQCLEAARSLVVLTSAFFPRKARIYTGTRGVSDLCNVIMARAPRHDDDACYGTWRPAATLHNTVIKPIHHFSDNSHIVSLKRRVGSGHFICSAQLSSNFIISQITWTFLRSYMKSTWCRCSAVVVQILPILSKPL